MEYSKIDTLFERDENFRVDSTKLKSPVLNTINIWDVTEKIDGINIRVMLSAEGELTFGGRGENTQWPTGFLQYLTNTFTAEKMKAVFWRPEPTAAILYGEGYGAGIQKGGSYRPDKAFRLFDVLVDNKWWLDQTAIDDIAGKLAIKTVPYLGRYTLNQISEMVKVGVPSAAAFQDSGQRRMAEGVVARPIETLFDKKGARLIIKLKTKDFTGGKR